MLFEFDKGDAQSDGLLPLPSLSLSSELLLLAISGRILLAGSVQASCWSCFLIQSLL